MILQCPACQSQYRIKADAVSTEGRKVKCKKCENIWVAQAQDKIEESVEVQHKIAVGESGPPMAHKEPPHAPEAPKAPVEVVHTSDQEVEREDSSNVHIPEESDAVKETAVEEKAVEEAVIEPVSTEALSEENPSEENASETAQETEAREYPRMKPSLDPDGRATPRFAAKHIEKKKGSGLVAFSVTVLVIGFFITAVIFGRVGIVKHWPATALAYDMVGLHVPVTGEGLRFENIQTSYDKDVEGDAIILLEGEIKNISAINRSVPLVAIKPHDPKNIILANTKVKINSERLEPGEVTRFSAEVPATITLDPQDKFVFIDG